MLTIKILGPGGANCARLEEIARKSAADIGVEAEFVRVTDHEDMRAYGGASAPGLVIEEKLVSSGRIPAPASVTDWIADALNAA